MIVVKLFNVIQQSQATAAAAEEGLKAQRGTGKPTLPAPSLAKDKKKSKVKPNVLGQGKNGEFSPSSCGMQADILLRCARCCRGG